ncbi:DUF2975 domain-containing protein [Rhodococcus sp. ARC_M12]|uniref:DUF2975 domain-containing protein n=1 Tax=Rhodococcus navarretei TaxID=3128981 RepID=A0ABU9D386_9NOCA|nr:DUF2975 domain-containing protein [Rhodococcus sp. ARC_M12]MCJ0978893.1 DUF2975 domain-containing protein [Rhodococcus sp. ARC_M12]
MAYGLGSARANTWAMAFYAAAAMVWSGRRLWEYHSSDYVSAAVTPREGSPTLDLYGGQLQPGNAIELSVAKSDVQRLIGMIDFMRYGEIVAGGILILVGIFFAYRFFDNVIKETPFSTRASIDLAVVAACLVLYPVITGALRVMSTNAVQGALETTELTDTARSLGAFWLAVIVAIVLQFVYAVLRQGTKLARDAEGLV